MGEPATCTGCDGEGEVYRGSSIEGDDHDTCPVCGGSTYMPTAGEIAELRARLRELEGDEQVHELEKQQYRERIAALEQELRVARETASALEHLVEIINAAGLLNLSNGVQLGATSWYVKASDAMAWAAQALSAAKSSREPRRNAEELERRLAAAVEQWQAAERVADGLRSLLLDTLAWVDPDADPPRAGWDRRGLVQRIRRATAAAPTGQASEGAGDG